jgi:hypothetical protein
MFKEVRSLTKERQSPFQYEKEAQVGERMIYDSKPCVVLEKKKKYNVVRLTVKYDDGRIISVIGDLSRYKIM